MSATSASQRTESSQAFFKSPFLRFAKVTCLLILFSILFSSTLPLPIFFFLSLTQLTKPNQIIHVSFYRKFNSYFGSVCQCALCFSIYTISVPGSVGYLSFVAYLIRKKQKYYNKANKSKNTTEFTLNFATQRNDQLKKLNIFYLLLFTLTYRFLFITHNRQIQHNLLH